MRLKRIDPLSLATISAFMYAVMGLIIGAFMFVFMLMMSAVGSHAMSGADFPEALPALFSFGFAIAAPFLYGIMGFVTGLIGGWLYNLAARWFGGLKIELELPEQPAAPTV